MGIPRKLALPEAVFPNYCLPQGKPVSDKPDGDISRQVHRLGYFFREAIVEKAREVVGGAYISLDIVDDSPEPIPDKQEDINKQADAAIRDLFPRIPNTDRVMIIEHAFNKVSI